MTTAPAPSRAAWTTGDPKTPEDAECRGLGIVEVLLRLELRQPGLYAPHRLSDPLLVLDQRKTHVALTAGPEPHSRRRRHTGIGHEELRELERAHLLVGLRDRRPYEHRPLR